MSEDIDVFLDKSRIMLKMYDIIGQINKRPCDRYFKPYLLRLGEGRLVVKGTYPTGHKKWVYPQTISFKTKEALFAGIEAINHRYEQNPRKYWYVILIFVGQTYF